MQSEETEYRGYTLIEHEEGVTVCGDHSVGEVFESLEEAKEAVDQSVDYAESVLKAEAQAKEDAERSATERAKMEVALTACVGRIAKSYAATTKLEKAVLTATNKAIDAAIALGKELNAAKHMVKSLRKGKWLVWLKTNCPGVDERKAQRYMKLAETAKNPTCMSEIRKCESLNQAYAVEGPIEGESESGEQPPSDEEQKAAKEYLRIRNQLTKLHTTFSTSLPFPIEKQKELIEPLKMVQQAITEFIAKLEGQIVKIQEDKEFDKAA